MNPINCKKSNKKNISIKTSSISKDSVWTPNCFTLFIVSKKTRKNGQNWIHYYLKDNPKQKYHCFEQAFLQRFKQLTNLY